MTRVLRIELRRSAAPWVGLLLLAIGVAHLGLRNDASGRWTTLAALHRVGLLLLIPLALAGGAWYSRRERRQRMDELLATTPRPGAQRRLVAAAAVAVTVLAAHLLTFAVGAVRVAPNATYLPPGLPQTVAVGAVALVAAAWLGLSLGRVLPQPVVAPAAAVVAAGAIIAMKSSFTSDLDDQIPGFALLDPLLDGGDEFSVILNRVHAGQALWLVGLAVTAAGLLSAGRPRQVAFALVPALVGGALAVPLLPAGGPTAAYAFDHGAAALVCADGEPRVCVTRVHAATLPEVVGPARASLATLAKLPDAPTSAVERVERVGATGDELSRAPQPADTLWFPLYFDPSGRLELTGDEMRDEMLSGSIPWCPPTHPDDDDGWQPESAARSAASAWLRGRPPARSTMPNMAEFDEMEQRFYRDLTALPQDEQLRRMGALRRAAQDCRNALYPILAGETTP
ncbi:hypothetical protein [Micromonospora peucetia]|uniref:Uncharacterized protein n=1 Tax=Micromonospora peucetia TaxID=47871 RepID=A0ABZ1E926_9ACTN|nr:hypothetical protein [Micromonospora peucetia]WSA31329.1 hypothetical protein OIE14_24800 [Micromonospora peucetia]